MRGHPERLTGDAGVGAVSSLVGVTVFLLLLLFAVQLTLNLYATSAVTSVAFDAARSVAATDGDLSARNAAEAHARTVLDRFEEDGGRLEFAWDVTRPDVVVLDVQLDGGQGLEVLQAVRSEQPGIRFVVFSNNSGPAYRKRYLGAGAARFLDKSTEFGDLASAVTAVGASAPVAH